MHIRRIITKILKELYLRIIDIKKSRKLIKVRYAHKKLAILLDRYLDDFLDGKIQPFVASPLKPELIGKKIIWQFWHSGLTEDRPKIVKKCQQSVFENRGDYDVIVLTNNNIREYVQLPDFIWNKVGMKHFGYPNLTDLFRLYLLSAYGGIWIDATIYLSAPIDDYLLIKDFFVFQRSVVEPKNSIIFKRKNLRYFSWKKSFQVKMLSSFIIAKPDQQIINDLLTIMINFWKNEEKTDSYFYFQICFNRMIQRPEWNKLNCEIIGDTDCHLFQTVAKEKFNHRIWSDILSKSNIHKLTYFDKSKKVKSDTFADILLNGFKSDINAINK